MIRRSIPKIFSYTKTIKPPKTNYLSIRHVSIVSTATVEETLETKFRNKITSGKHVLFADEPLEFPGGTDTGPNPYVFLLSGLGACTSMTIRLYAERKKFPLERVSVQLKHEKIDNRDKFERIITLEGKDLTQEQKVFQFYNNFLPSFKELMLKIADKCPVHRTLSSKDLIIETKLA